MKIKSVALEFRGVALTSFVTDLWTEQKQYNMPWYLCEGRHNLSAYNV